jgi:peptidyl-prolyl cis-trans isomerase-like 2
MTVIVLHDPHNEDFQNRRDINTFYHVTHARELRQTAPDESNNVRHSVTAARIMEQLQKNKSKVNNHQMLSNRYTTTAATNSSNGRVILSRDVTGVAYTTGQGSASLTSTMTTVRSDNAERAATTEEILQAQYAVMRQRKRKGYVRMRTNHGDWTIELHADIAPRTCTNFLGLCRQGRYHGTLFHRLIPGFMLQGGGASPNPGGATTREKRRDESLWGDAFVDEFEDRLLHNGPGVVSMANSGPNTNLQQFFITFKACSHLDRKHSVFGQVVEGLEDFLKLEKMPRGSKDKPLQDITILETIVLVDPAQEAEEIEKQRLDEILDARERQALAVQEKTTKRVKSNPPVPEEKDDTSLPVGRYLQEKLKAAQTKASSHILPPPSKEAEKRNEAPSRIVAAPAKQKFNFSNW